MDNSTVRKFFRKFSAFSSIFMIPYLVKFDFKSYSIDRIFKINENESILVEFQQFLDNSTVRKSFKKILEVKTSNCHQLFGPGFGCGFGPGSEISFSFEEK